MSLFAKVSKREEFPIKEGFRAIELSGYNGSIRWVPLDGDGARIVAEKEAQGFSSQVLSEFLEDLRFEDHSTDEQMVLRAVEPPRPFGVVSSQVRLIVYASPQQIVDFQAQTSNGSIKVQTPFNGRLRLTTSNGSVTLQSGTGNVDIRTSNGRIELGQLCLRESSSVRSSNGRIAGQVELPDRGNYLFESNNGAIDLRVPHDTPGLFEATTSNGRIEFNVGEDRILERNRVTIQRRQGPTVRLATSNGKITVMGY